MPSTEVLQKALRLLEGKALFEGHAQAVFVRLAESDDAIYLDLTNAAWEAAEITPYGWQVMPRPPVKFLRRPRSALTAPTQSCTCTAIKAPRSRPWPAFSAPWSTPIKSPCAPNRAASAT